MSSEFSGILRPTKLNKLGTCSFLWLFCKLARSYFTKYFDDKLKVIKCKRIKS